MWRFGTEPLRFLVARFPTARYFFGLAPLDVGQTCFFCFFLLACACGNYCDFRLLLSLTRPPLFPTQGLRLVRFPNAPGAFMRFLTQSFHFLVGTFRCTPAFSDSARV